MANIDDQHPKRDHPDYHKYAAEYRRHFPNYFVQIFVPGFDPNFHETPENF